MGLGAFRLRVWPVWLAWLDATAFRGHLSGQSLGLLGFGVLVVSADAFAAFGAVE